MLSAHPAQPWDIPGAYRVAALTADCGDPLPFHGDGDSDLVGHVYVGPYFAHALAYATILADEQGIAGYLLATPDTVTFAQWAAESWWPALAERYGETAAHPVLQEFVSAFTQPPFASPAVATEYPAHLHIDLLPRARGRGWGRKLLTGLFQRLAQEHVPGIHLVVARENISAVQFYDRLGFSKCLADAGTFTLVRRLGTVPPVAPSDDGANRPTS